MDPDGLRVVSLMSSMMTPRTVGPIARLPPAPHELVNVAKFEAVNCVPKRLIRFDYFLCSRCNSPFANVEASNPFNESLDSATLVIGLWQLIFDPIENLVDVHVG
jgi:hypothetical protein